MRKISFAVIVLKTLAWVKVFSFFVHTFVLFFIFWLYYLVTKQKVCWVAFF